MTQWRKLRKPSKLIYTMAITVDIGSQIAGRALSLNLTLVTSNLREFSLVPGLN